MQAVILAAGNGMRMRPLTEHTPKPLVRAAGVPLLEHNLRVLPDEVTELVVVVGYLKEQIIAHFGNSWNGKKIVYVEQKEQKGTGHALYLCKEYVHGTFLVMMADDIHSARDIRAAIAGGNNVVLVKKSTKGFSGGKVVVDSDNTLVSIEEGTHEAGSLVNTALYVLTDDIFNYTPVAIKEGKEFGLPQTIVARMGTVKTVVVEALDWVQISTPADVLAYEATLSHN